VVGDPEELTEGVFGGQGLENRQKVQDVPGLVILDFGSVVLFERVQS